MNKCYLIERNIVNLITLLIGSVCLKSSQSLSTTFSAYKFLIYNSRERTSIVPLRSLLDPLAQNCSHHSKLLLNENALLLSIYRPTIKLCIQVFVHSNWIEYWEVRNYSLVILNPAQTLHPLAAFLAFMLCFYLLEMYLRIQ